MRVLVAGATSVLGGPVLRELRRRGHEPVALARNAKRLASIVEDGAHALRADVFDLAAIDHAVAAVKPEAVISLLITLPKSGPTHVRHYRRTVDLWRRGVPNLIAAAERHGVTRLIAESVIFAYGYGRRGPERVTETDAAEDGGVIRGQAEVLEALRQMERRVLGAALDGIVLRYGAFHGREVASTQFLLRSLRWRVPVVLGEGRGAISWIEIGDAARATVDALDRGRGGEIYNVVDDQPIRFADYARELAAASSLPRPRYLPGPLAKLFVPNARVIVDETQLPVSNAKARRELGWQPAHATPAAAFAQMSKPEEDR